MKHGIKLREGTPNSANGDCAFESTIYNVNDRDSFPDKLHFSPDYYRRIWMTDMKKRTLHDQTWNICSMTEWEDGLADMMVSGVYERGIFGDLMLLGIACGVRKFILIFNTSLEAPHDPIYVCDPRKFGVEPDSQIPVVLAYDLSHYESMHPVDQQDTLKTIELVEKYLSGNYEFGRRDLPLLLQIDYQSGERGKDLNSDFVENDSKDQDVGISNFQDSLPEHLRGKRPRELSEDEKREYNNFKQKFSRSKKTKQQQDITRQKNAQQKAEKKMEETDTVRKERQNNEAKTQANKRFKETKTERQERQKRDNEEKVKKKLKEAEAETVRHEMQFKKSKAQAKRRSRET